MDGILVCGFEVTDQVRAAQELARLLAQAEASERQFRELVENLPELAWTARPDGFIDYYNRRWYDYTGTTLEEMQGWGWTVASTTPPSSTPSSTRWQHSIDTGEPFEMEFPLRGADGVFRWFLTRVQPAARRRRPHRALVRVEHEHRRPAPERRLQGDVRGHPGPRPAQSR